MIRKHVNFDPLQVFNNWKNISGNGWKVIELFGYRGSCGTPKTFLNSVKMRTIHLRRYLVAGATYRTFAPLFHPTRNKTRSNNHCLPSLVLYNAFLIAREIRVRHCQQRDLWGSLPNPVTSMSSTPFFPQGYPEIRLGGDWEKKLAHFFLNDGVSE